MRISCHVRNFSSRSLSREHGPRPPRSPHNQGSTGAHGVLDYAGEVVEHAMPRDSLGGRRDRRVRVLP
jgi:hypothetical protein